MKVLRTSKRDARGATPRSHRVLAIVGNTQVGLWVTRSLGLRISRPSAAVRFVWHSGPWTQDDVFVLDNVEPFCVDALHILRRLGTEMMEFVRQR